ncbi:hypothetical protein WISP_33805 [Willisornis vidua]|uniref:Rna-directed dna polymerase from mobile element jockey-like n=1 Tax=Willisornis vidua TaxID=1566151 RepID=A0ABQ9DKQ5_9PASS|nr:hypothetical protein WISP_33805 [Willisornis vidua]
MIEVLKRNSAMLDLFLTSKAGLLGNMKLKGNLGCSDPRRGDMDSRIEHTLSKFANNTKLCGVVDTLEGRGAIGGTPLDRFEKWGQSCLMNIFIYDPNEGIECTVSKFADETKLGRSTDMLKSGKAMQRDLDMLDWWVKNSVMFNKAKCQVLNVGYGNPV